MVLLEHGAKVNVKTSNGFTCMHACCATGQQEILGLILENKKVYWDDHWSTHDFIGPIHMATFFHQNDVVRYLLELKADPDHSYSKFSVLEVAKLRKNFELLDSGALFAYVKSRQRSKGRGILVLDIISFGVPEYLKDSTVITEQKIAT